MAEITEGATGFGGSMNPFVNALATISVILAIVYLSFWGLMTLLGILVLPIADDSDDRKHAFISILIGGFNMILAYVWLHYVWPISFQ